MCGHLIKVRCVTEVGIVQRDGLTKGKLQWSLNFAAGSCTRVFCATGGIINRYTTTNLAAKHSSEISGIQHLILQSVKLPCAEKESPPASKSSDEHKGRIEAIEVPAPRAEKQNTGR